MRPAEALSRARLYFVVEAVPDEIVRAALRGGADMVQLRVKDASDDEVLAAAARFRALCDEHGALFWLNDRPDLALEAGADGVHVGQDDTAVAQVRDQVGDRMLIGLSTHSPAQLEAALRSGSPHLARDPCSLLAPHRLAPPRADRPPPEGDARELPDHAVRPS